VKGGVVKAAFLGTGAALFFHAARRVLWALFWPRVGAGILALALTGAAVGAAAVCLLAAGKSGMPRGRAPWRHHFWGAAAGTWLLLCGGLQARPVPEAGVSGLLLFALVTALPLAATAALLAGSEDRREAAAFLLFFGAGLAAAGTLSCLHPRGVAAAGIIVGTLPAVFPGKGTTGWRIGAAPLLCGAALLALPAVTPFTAARIPAAAVGVQGTGPATPGADWCGDTVVETHQLDGGQSLVTVGGGLWQEKVGPREKERLMVTLPRGEDDRLDVLALGMPAAGVLHFLLEKKESRFVIVVPDRHLAERVVQHWPELNEARQEGRAEVRTASPRWYLRKDPSRYDVILLGAGVSAAAHIAAALAFEERYLYTKEAFQEYVKHLAPQGVLFVRRPGNGRVVSTLREAAGEDVSPAFRETVAVLGRKGRIVSDLYYRPAGFSGKDNSLLGRAARQKGVEVFYSPRTKRKWNLYFSLVRGERRGGYSFSSPQDLSPVRDERPFMEHFERLMISPGGPPLPEERGRLSGEWRLSFIPPGDRVFWAALLAVLALAPAALVVPLRVCRQRAGSARHALTLVGPALLAGGAGAVCLRALTAFASWPDPLPGHTGVTEGFFFAAAGAAWAVDGGDGSRGRRALMRLAALALVLGVAGYPLAHALMDAGRGWWVVMVAALVLTAGWLTGSSAGAVGGKTTPAVLGAKALYVSAVLSGSAFGWAASALLAVTFGFHVVWMVAALLALWALRVSRRL
jgi:hypothetical protein